MNQTTINFKFKGYDGTFPIDTFKGITEFLPLEDKITLSQTSQQLKKIYLEILFKYYEDYKCSSCLSSKQFVRLSIANGERVTVLNLSNRMVLNQTETKNITKIDMLRIAKRCPNVKKIIIGGSFYATWVNWSDDFEMKQKFIKILKKNLSHFRNLEELDIKDQFLNLSQSLNLLQLDFGRTLSCTLNPFHRTSSFKRIVTANYTLDFTGLTDKQTFTLTKVIKKINNYHTNCTELFYHASTIEKNIELINNNKFNISNITTKIFDVSNLKQLILNSENNVKNNQLHGLVFYQIPEDEIEQILTLLGSCNPLKTLIFRYASIEFTEERIKLLTESKQMPELLGISMMKKEYFEMLASSPFCKGVKKLQLSNFQLDETSLCKADLISTLTKHFTNLEYLSLLDGVWENLNVSPTFIIEELTNNPKFLPNLCRICISDEDSLEIIEEKNDTGSMKLFAKKKELMEKLYIARPHLFIDLYGVGGRYVDNLDYFTPVKK